MRKHTIAAAFLVLSLYQANAQAPRGISIEEYQKAKAFKVADLDNDTYVKFDNTYVLDRYEGKKPYFITGDDGNKKRVDLYALSSKRDGSNLGTVIFYTNEKGKQYAACLPNNFADGKVWEQYFTDIHAIDKEEPNFVLKLSYVLSREFSFQAYKSTLKGGEADRAEAATYGNDICFPGDEEVLMADGSKKQLASIVAGDQVITVDPATGTQKAVTVKQLITHEARNYAVTQLTLVRTQQVSKKQGHEVHMSIRKVEATPNHPITTPEGNSSFGALREGQQVWCLNKETNKYEPYQVWQKNETVQGTQQVYNMDAEGGSTFVIDGVMVLQKQPQN